MSQKPLEANKHKGRAVQCAFATQDSISHLFSHIKNGQKAKALIIEFAASKKIISILNVLLQNGYIRGFRTSKSNDKMLVHILLRYKNQHPAISQLIRISKPSKRIYIPVKQLAPTKQDSRDLSFGAISILSTSKGILSNVEAYKLNVGGELLGQV